MRLLKFSALVFAVIASATAIAAPDKAAPADPFIGGTWHAVGQTWPGTMAFDSEKKEIVMIPVGAQAMTSKYEFKLEKKGKQDKSAKEPAPDAEKTLAGTLKLTNKDGRAVTAKFTIIDEVQMNLVFEEGQRQENYLLMTPEDEETERQRINKLAAEGKLTSQNPMGVQPFNPLDYQPGARFLPPGSPLMPRKPGNLLIP